MSVYCQLSGPVSKCRSSRIELTQVQLKAQVLELSQVLLEALVIKIFQVLYVVQIL